MTTIGTGRGTGPDCRREGPGDPGAFPFIEASVTLPWASLRIHGALDSAPAAGAATAQDVVEPGTYQLDVRRTDSAGTVFRDEADLTIGATGTRGPAGPEGPQGAAGISAYEVVVENTEITISTNETITVAATCPQGKRVLGGSCQGLGFGGHLHLVSSSNYPYDPNWTCQWANPDEPKTIRLRVTAICATVP